MDPETPCPDPELLAAYVDAALTAVERDAVAHHLAHCTSCRLLAAEVVRIQDAVPSARPEPVAAGHGASSPSSLSRLLSARRGVVGVGGVALVVALLLWLVSAPGVWRDAADGHHARLAEAAGPERAIEARLSGPFRYAPLRVPVRTGDGVPAVSRPWTLVAAAGEIRDAHHADLSAASQHATGVAALLVGDYGEAIRALQAAVDVSTSSAAILVDLAAAHHERARLGGRPDDLPRALAAAERAIAADPTRADAWFNRALALEAIAPRDLAREAWERYLAHETDEDWRREGQARLAALQPATAPWTEVRASLDGPADQALVDAAVRAHTSRARDFLERELIPRWASAVVEGGDDATPLGLVRLLADAFARLAGDQFGQDVVAAIDRAQAEGRGRALAEAVRAYAALPANVSILPGRGPEDIVRGRDGLRAAGLPLQWRAEIDLASANYYRGRYDDVTTALARVEVAARRDGYADVLGQALWLTGMTAFAQGRLGDARHHYEQMLEVGATMGDAERISSASLLLANLFFYIGDSAQAWRYRADAAAAFEDREDTRVEHGLLISAAGDALVTGSPEAALVFQAAALRTAEALGPLVATELYAQIARTHHTLGAQQRAVASLNEARALLEGIEDATMRARVSAAVRAAEAEVLLEVDPSASAEAARAALEPLRTRGDRLGMARLSLLLADSLLARGDGAGAEAAIGEGLAAFTAERASLTDEGRIPYSDRSWALYEQAIRVAIERDDLEAAFRYSEQGRARTIVEARQWGGDDIATLADVRAGLEPGVALLVLNQFDDALVSWLVRRDGVSTARVALPRQRAGTVVTAYARGITTGGGGTHASGELYDALIRPHAAVLGGARLLVIVPDRPYGNVAFAGLVDRRRGRFLVEDLPLAVAPSATVYARASLRTASADAPRSALVLGAPSASAGSGVASLPASRDEATTIAALYPGAELRAGVSATPARLLDDAPGRDVVHVAAHGVTNPEYPLLSRLLLADLPGRPYSGAVFASEVAARDFTGTSLVVLAACDSGGGSEARGEGALSLARAFLAAGVPTVVSALGPLDDTLARQMFVEFHRGYRRGASAAESLQQVQVQALQRTGRQPGAWARLAVFGASHTQDRTEGDPREP